MDILDKDLKVGDSPSGDGQPEKKVVIDSDAEPNETDNESEGNDKETIAELESKLEKLSEERDNYKKGMFKARLSHRNLPGSEAPAPKKKVEDDDDGWGDPVEPEESEYVTKKDFQKLQEKGAIKKACVDMPELDENWDEIIPFYHSRKGKATEEGIIEDLRDATDLWKLRSGYKTPTGNEKNIKKTTKSILEDRGINKGNDKTPKAPKKTILKKDVGMDRWYSKE